MSYNINLGAWGSVFAVPSALVDSHLKIATESQLKVLLYILRNSGVDNSVESISKAVSVHEDEVKNALIFWIERGLVASVDSTLSVPQNAEAQVSVKPQESEPQPKTKPRAMSRAQHPDSMFVARRLSEDSSLAWLMDEAQIALAKPLSSGDTATLVMLHDTDGLPCEVLALLINYCVSIGKGNMRTIERLGIQWASEGILTVQDAERKIIKLSQSSGAWARVSKIFGLKNIGSPTKTQLSLADIWCNEWKFSDDMLLEAYERCVDIKGEYNIKYINGILSKWHQSSIFNLDALKAADAAASKAKTKKNTKTVEERHASYDLDALDSKSLFND
ncbi:MAG: DnaD domain protein [Ruminococcus sp.]|nr:DnaD domain protein [Ruminococcus sp.]